MLSQPGKFRAYYFRIFRLTQVGLQGTDPSRKQAKAALDSLTVPLIDDEGLHIKTSNLGETGIQISLPLAIAYFVLRLAGEGDLDRPLDTLEISRVVMATFMLLWIGCFAGVFLSYGIRTETVKLVDLVNPGPDRLPPGMQLLFIGTLTMLFGLLFVKDIVEFKIGSFSTPAIASDSTLAIIIGVFFGLGESAAPLVLSTMTVEHAVGLNIARTASSRRRRSTVHPLVRLPTGPANG